MTPLSHLQGGAHIVCANQKRELLDFIVCTLRQDDHFAFQASDGVAALALCQSLPNTDLLITNTHMPGLNGPQLIRQVREKLPTLPALYVRNADPAHAGVPEGLPRDVPTLREPFSAEQLLDAVRPLLGRWRESMEEIDFDRRLGRDRR